RCAAPPDCKGICRTGRGGRLSLRQDGGVRGQGRALGADLPRAQAPPRGSLRAGRARAGVLRQPRPRPRSQPENPALEDHPQGGREALAEGDSQPAGVSRDGAGPGYPMHVVCAWIGNSAAVAAAHYLQVVEADFAKAATLTLPAESRAAPSDTERHRATRTAATAAAR